MLRGYMTNRTVYSTAIAFDFLILHVATMLLCTKLFSDTSYFYFVLMLLPVTFVTVYVILRKV